MQKMLSKQKQHASITSIWINGEEQGSLLCSDKKPRAGRGIGKMIDAEAEITDKYEILNNLQDNFFSTVGQVSECLPWRRMKLFSWTGNFHGLKLSMQFICQGEFCAWAIRTNDSIV
jgi:hypothetical protein